MRNRAFMGAIAVLLLAAAFWSDACAQQPSSAGQASPAPGWEFNLAPYLWFPTVSMSLQYNLPPALGGRLPTDASVGPGEVYGHFDFGGMFSADARNGRFSVLTDLVGGRFSGVTNAANIKSIDFFGRSPIPISRSQQISTGTTLRVVIWTLAGGYTVLQRDWGNIDLIAGLRYLAVDSTTDFNLALRVSGPRGNGATFGGIGSISASPGIWNGIGGIRGRIRLGDNKLFIPYYFDIGAGGSQLTWQISSGLGYQFNKWGAVSVTYRYLTFHQGGRSDVDSLTFKGPILMANFRF